MTYSLVFDEVMIRQLKKLARNNVLKKHLTTLLDKLASEGPHAGKILDRHFGLYEMKQKRPSLRMYFHYNATNNEIHVFEFEIKKSHQRQQQTINALRSKIRDRRE